MGEWPLALLRGPRDCDRSRLSAGLQRDRSPEKQVQLGAALTEVKPIYSTLAKPDGLVCAVLTTALGGRCRQPGKASERCLQVIVEAARGQAGGASYT